MTYAIKAYGDTATFRNKAKFRQYLMEWIAGTEGSERDRAVKALVNLEAGVRFTDTDVN